jgi:hypothetical protein
MTNNTIEIIIKMDTFFGKTDGFIGFDKANIKNKINKSTTAISI